MALLGAVMSGLAVGAQDVPAVSVDRAAAARQSNEIPDAAPHARVSGRVIPSEGFQLIGGTVSIAAIVPSSTAGPDAGVLMPDGSFAFTSVPPGTYEIRARGQLDPGGATHLATFRLLVEGRDVTGVLMPLLPGAVLSGRVTFDGSGTPATAGLRVRAPLPDGTTFGEALSGDVMADGSFVLRGLLAGTHLVRVEGLPEGWVLQRVLLRGQDITDAGLDAGHGQRIEHITIALTRTASDLAGRITDAAGAPVPDALVLVIPLAEQFWHAASRRLAVLRSDAAGRYRIRGLPDGEYRASAALDVEMDDAYRPDVLRSMSARGVPLTIGGVTPRILDLTLTSSRAGRAPAR